MTETLADKLAEFGTATHNELFDTEYNGGEWMVSHVETHETLADWEASSIGWQERSPMVRGKIAGFPFLAWNRMQALKGMPRDHVSVIDFGDIRIALPGTFLADYL